MKKIGIITLNGYFNYGNRLQNYALQETIRSLNFECETILNNTYILKKESSKIIDKLKGKSLKQQLFYVYKIINHRKIEKLYEMRAEKFREFTLKYINETSFFINKENIPEGLEKDYEYFIAGSDQVWNPNDPMVSEINFLTFAPISKRVSYAASFGVSEIPDMYKNDYKRWISEVKHLSVREERGACIVKELTGIDAEVVIDPTMLLTKDEWLNIANSSENKPNSNYLLTYFLGEISKTVKMKINEIGAKYNLKIVNLATLKEKKYYLEGPSEFIDYINSASLFITDSFHGCVFSMLMETPFLVCEREGYSKAGNMNSRIETFLKKFNLNSRKIVNYDESKLFNINYDEANKILKTEKERAIDFLKNSIGK